MGGGGEDTLSQNSLKPCKVIPVVERYNLESVATILNKIYFQMGLVMKNILHIIYRYYIR